MTFYHFTSKMHLPMILEQGAIVKGDVPTSPGGGFNAPWLTLDPNAKKQDWKAGSIVDKTEVRFTVEIPEEHQGKLVKWSAMRDAGEVEDWWYETLDQVAGGGSDNWYIYLGEIPLEWTTIERMER